MIASLLGENYPDQKKVFLDAEKALIKAMQPSYNKELFKNYPFSKDGLYHDNYDTIGTLPVKSWYEYIAEPTLADAIMDRLTAYAHKIELKGESLRNKK